MDSSKEDQRLPHQLDPPQPVSLEDLENCGVLYWKVIKTNFKLGCIVLFKKIIYQQILIVHHIHDSSGTSTCR